VGVNIIPGTKFFAGTDPVLSASARHHVRLSYSFASLTQIDTGMSRLARVYESLLAG
jgi:DNA-binding transcriptional MocR family regulator